MKHNQLVMHITSSSCTSCNNRWTHSEVWLAGASPNGLMTFGLIPNSLQKKQLPITYICLTEEPQPKCFRCINPTLPNLWSLKPNTPPSQSDVPPKASPVQPEPETRNALEEIEQLLGITKNG